MTDLRYAPKLLCQLDPCGVMCWIYSAVIEPNLLYGVAFWWTALDKLYNVRLLDGVIRFAAIRITGALGTTPTKVLFAMLNWFPTEILPKQVAKFTATRLNDLSC